MIRVLALDIDGVLTDGRVTMDEAGRESKTLSYRDIDAIFMARRRGMEVVLVTGEATPWVRMIARRLEISHVYSGAKDKRKAMLDLCAEMGLTPDEVCYVGDSPRDADALGMVGLGLAPADATHEALKAACRVLVHRGGEGVVAEAIEIVLETLREPTDTPLDGKGS